MASVKNKKEEEKIQIGEKNGKPIYSKYTLEELKQSPHAEEEGFDDILKDLEDSIVKYTELNTKYKVVEAEKKEAGKYLGNFLQAWECIGLVLPQGKLTMVRKTNVKIDDVKLKRLLLEKGFGVEEIKELMSEVTTLSVSQYTAFYPAGEKEE